jgi:hypothetical protein
MRLETDTRLRWGRAEDVAWLWSQVALWVALERLDGYENVCSLLRGGKSA